MHEESFLNISHMEEHTDLLGPGDRFVLWLHGCCFDCEDCLAHNTRSGAFERWEVSTLSERILQSGCEGMTLSGGEPFLQATALSQLITAVRQQKDLGVIAYSGFTVEEIRQRKDFLPLLRQVDLLIDGPYRRELDDGRAYVGSSNQRILYLTPRYMEIGKAYYAQEKRRAEIKLTPHQAILIGVPSRPVLEVWKKLKEKSGGSCNDF